MKRHFIILLIALIYKSNLLYGQFSSEILNQFPIHILLQIYETEQKTSLSATSQFRLGNYFMKKDSLAREALTQGTPLVEVANHYTTKEENLQKILSPLEYNEYRLAIRGISGCSRLREMVRYRKSLRLTEIQVQELIRQSNVIEDIAGQEGFKQSEKEHQIADSLLTPRIHLEYYRLKNKTEASNATKKNLADLQEYSFCTTPTDSILYFSAICQYELNNRSTLEYWKDSEKQEKYEQMKLTLEKQIPAILQQLKVYKSMPWWSVIKNALNRREELKLSHSQSDSLFTGFEACLQQEEAHKQNKSNTRFDRKVEEYKQLVTILSPGQFDHLLRQQKQDRAKENAQWDWENLLKYKLVEQKDHNRVINEMYAYELKLLVAGEWLYIDNSREHVFARRDITDNKPKLLKLLDVTRKKEAKSKIIRF